MRYIGQRTVYGTEVWVERDGVRKPLDLRLDLVAHSPTGFEWGYGGSGPAQLALAILADFLTEEMAMRLYQDFKWEVIAHLPHQSWELTEDDILDWLGKRENVKILLKYISQLEVGVGALKEEMKLLEELLEKATIEEVEDGEKLNFSES